MACFYAQLVFTKSCCDVTRTMVTKGELSHRRPYFGKIGGLILKSER